MDGPEIIERHDLILDELEKIGLRSARDLIQRQEAAETSEEAARLGMALAQVSRAVRHALALQSRLKRDLRRDRREEAEDAKASDKTARQQHADAIRAAVRRSINSEARDYERIELIARTDLALMSDREDPDFLDVSAERHIQRLCKALGLQPPQAPSVAPKGATPPPTGEELGLCGVVVPPPQGEVSAKPTEGASRLAASPSPPGEKVAAKPTAEGSAPNGAELRTLAPRPSSDPTARGHLLPQAGEGRTLDST